MKNEIVHNELIELKKDYNFFYSPAYLEEIANIKGNDENLNRERRLDHFNKITEITDNNELRPTIDAGVALWKEEPIECYQRVIDDYEATITSEKINENFYNKKDVWDIVRNSNGFSTEQLNNIKPSAIFNLPPVKEFVTYNTRFGDVYLEALNIWEIHEENFSLLEKNIEELFNVLEVIGYYPEKSKNKRSRMHDITHAIYATKVNYFVVEDYKLRMKSEAIYSFLGAKTKVLSYEKFLNNSTEIIIN